jgi:hypothetical protein
MKTLTIGNSDRALVAETPHEVLVRLQTQVDEEVARAAAQAIEEARQQAAAQQAAKPAPGNRVRFAYD